MEMKSEIRSFVESQEPGKISSAWDVNGCTYDPISDGYVSVGKQNIQTLAAKPTDHFLCVMRAFQKNYPEDSSLARFNIRNARSWNDVLSTAEMAQEKYNAKTKGFPGLFVRSGRKVGEASEAIIPFLDILPQSEYISIVFGGIILILKASKQMADRRQKVVATLGSTPQLFEDMESLVRLYPLDHKLNVKVHHLYIALLATIEGIIEWFGHRIWEPMKAFMQQGLYAKNFDDKTALLDSCAKDVQHQANLCHQQNSAKILDAIESQRAASNNLSEQIDRKFGDVEVEVRLFRSEMKELQFYAIEEVSAQVGSFRTDMSSHFNDVNTTMDRQFRSSTTQMSDGFDGIKTQMDMQIQKLSNIEEFMNERVLLVAKAAAKNALAEQLSSDLENLEWRLEEQTRKTEFERTRAASLEQELQLQRSRTPLPPPPPPQSCMSQVQVHQALGDINSFAKGDLAHYIQLARTMNPNPVLADLIMSNAKFGSWFASSMSQMLFIAPNMSLEKVSAASFVTATLGQAIGQMPTPIPLIHFCRGPTAITMGAQPASHLIASLISQLLSQRQFDLTKWSAITSLQDHYKSLQSLDLHYLCEFFKHLVDLLPYGTIFCLVDDFYHLERTTDDNSLTVIIQCFLELVQTTIARARAVFKVLVMTPDNKGSVVQYAPEQDLLRIGQGVSMDHRGYGMMPKQQRFQMEYARRKRGGSWMDSSPFDP